MSTLNLEQAAAFLHMHPMTLLRRAQSGLVPAAKPGKRWVFVEVDLIEYLRSQYSQQASQGGIEGLIACHSTSERTLVSGGTKSDSEAGYYRKALELPTR